MSYLHLRLRYLKDSLELISAPYTDQWQLVDCCLWSLGTLTICRGCLCADRLVVED